jgi:hypothetical protein
VKNATNIRDNAARNMTDIDEATVQRQAFNITYNAFKDTPGFKKYLASTISEPSSTQTQSNVKIDDTKASSQVPAAGTTKVINGVTYISDGKGWMKK